MKIQITQQQQGGFKGPRTQVKVLTLADGETMPTGAVAVSDETPEHDWQDEETPAP